MNIIDMHKYVNMDNVNSCRVSFKGQKSLVNSAYKPKLLSEMVAEAQKTGQLPFSSPLSVLDTYTDNIDAISPEVLGDDKIDSLQRSEQVMSMIESLEDKKKRQEEEYQKAVKAAEDEKLKDFLSKNQPPAPSE